MPSETNREVAERITKRWGSQYRTQLADAIEAVLDARDERAAKIADTDAEMRGFASESRATAKRIAAAIRGKD